MPVHVTPELQRQPVERIEGWKALATLIFVLSRSDILWGEMVTTGIQRIA